MTRRLSRLRACAVAGCLAMAMEGSSPQARAGMVCDLADPAPQARCEAEYPGFPLLILQCAQDEAQATQSILSVWRGLAAEDVEACARAGCQAKFRKARAIADCMSLYSRASG